MRKGLKMGNDFRSHKLMTAPALLTFPAFIFISHILQANPDVTILLETKPAVNSYFCFF